MTERPKKDVVAFSEHVRHHNGATLFLFVLLIAPSGRANSQPTPSVPGEIGVFAETVVQSIPPELAADLLIQIADSQASVKGTSNWRERLYEHAFQLAGSAQEPVKLTIVPGGPTDSRDGMLTQGFRYGIDGMSLQARALKGLFPLRPKRALELADAVDVALSTLTCRDTMVPDPSAAYDLARILAADQTQPRDDAVALLERLVFGVRSSSQIAPALKSIRSSTLPEQQSRSLLSTSAAILAKLSDDDVTFSASLGDTWLEVKRIVETLGNDPFATTFLEAFRDYLVLHFSGERCVPESLSRADLFSHDRDRALVADINALFARKKLAVLSRKDLTPKATQPAATNVLLWRSAPAKTLFEDFRALKFDGRRERSAAEKRTPEWTAALDHFYTALATWTPTDRGFGADYFHERCILLISVIGIVPSDAERHRALDELIRFLRAEGIQRFKHVEWFGYVRGLIDRYGKGTADRAWVLRALRESGDPVMRAYADAEELLRPIRRS